MSTRAPVDQHHRTAIQERLGETLFVEAGAGTGKTTQLVGRVVGLVESGVDMRRIAAITFTEAAAAELRSRIREALELAAQGGSDKARRAVEEVDEAAVSTLHSFAQRMLGEHSLEAGLPPVFDVRDEIQSGLAFQEWWAATLEELLADAALKQSWFRLLALGLKADRLRLLAKTLHDHWDRLESRTAEEAGLDLDRIEDDLKAAIAHALRELRRAGEAAADCDTPDDTICQLLTEMGEIANTADSHDEPALLARMALLEDAKGGSGKKDNWPGGLEGPKAVRDAAVQSIGEVIRLACDASFHRLMAAVAQQVLAAADERRRNGELEFHDLLVLARRLLRSDPDVRRRLKDRWHRLLIDEFQDTDPIQVELAALLATDSDDVVVKQLPQLEPGRLFFVGDARQSIYRFRRADLALFRSVADALDEAVVPLTQNFRSVPGITAWVNTIIGPMLGSDQYNALDPARKPLPGTKGPVVKILGGPSTENLPAVRTKEAEEIAWSLKRIVGAGGLHPAWKVADGDDGATRNARYDDIAILLPTRASLSFIERALEDEKIPYRVESSSLVWATQEVRDLLACLRAIDDAGDEVSVVGALRSVVLGCSDEDLLEWAQAGGKWNVGAPRPEAIPQTHPVFVGLTKLLALSEQRFWAGVSGLVERTARELGFFELALAHSRARDSWRRLRHVIDEVRAFERSGSASLRQFLVWAEAQDAEGARAKEAVLPQPDHRAVRILTVHGAKGLEFPICILAGLNSKGAGPNLGRVLWSETGSMEAAFSKGRRTSGFSELENTERTEEAEEVKRLLYVAATRAEDHLVVSLHHKDEPRAKPSERSRAAILWAACAEHPDLWTTMPAELPLSAVPVDPPAPLGDLATERREWAAARDEAIDRLSRSNVRAATELKDGDGAATDDAVERQPWQRGRGGTSLGRAVHATLQTIDLATGEGVADTARAQAAAEGIAHRADEVEARARAALGSAVAAEAAKSRHWRELYVGAPVGDLTVEGYIDLLYETPEGLVLVDWKTDAIDPRAERTEAITRYGKQVQAYADVLEVALGQKVIRAELVFLSDKEAVPVTIEL